MSITTTAEPVTSTIALDQSKEINANLPVLTNNSEYKERLRQLPEVQNMTSLISIEEPNSVLLLDKNLVNKFHKCLMQCFQVLNQ